MSRIAKKPIPIPQKTEVSYSGGVVSVKGPLGELKKTIRSEEVDLKTENGSVVLSPKKETKTAYSLWGTYASHLKNMLKGVNTPYEKKLIVEGIGFKSEVKGKDIHLALGFSHPVKITIPEGLKVTSDKNIISVSGIDCEKVGEFAAKIRSLKKPEPYKGKGIRYDDEVIRRKQGKKSV